MIDRSAGLWPGSPLLRPAALLIFALIAIASDSAVGQTPPPLAEPSTALNAATATLSPADLDPLFAESVSQALLDAKVREALAKVSLHARSQDIADQLGFDIDFRYQIRAAYVDDGTDEETDISMRRVRLGFGFRLDEYDLRARIAVDLVGGEDADEENPAGIELSEAYGTWTPSDHFRLRFGQFRPSTNRPRSVASSDLLFLERSTWSGTYGRSIRPGVSARGAIDEASLELGIYEGQGESIAEPDAGLLFTGRLAIHPLGRVRMDESSTAFRGGEPELELGLFGWHEKDGRRQALDGLGVDAIFRYERVTAMVGAALRESRQARRDRRGLFAQTSVLLYEQDLELAARVARTWSEDRAEEDEALASLTWFLDGHDLKWQFEAGYVREEDEPESFVARVQFQIAF